MGRSDGWRFWLPVLLLAVFAAYSGQKLIRAHISLDPDIKLPNYDKTWRLQTLRGAILPAGDSICPFVKSVPIFEYRFDPKQLEKSLGSKYGQKRFAEGRGTKKAVLKAIAAATGISYRKLCEMYDYKGPGRNYQLLGRSTDPEMHQILTNRSLVAGVSVIDSQERKYFCGRSLCHVINGVERRYYTELNGEEGVIYGKRDASNREIYDRRVAMKAPTLGSDVYLTIDPTVQLDAERCLSWGIGEYGAGAGWCIVMDARTGAILAMASQPDFDPARPDKASEEARRNRTIAFRYEPGSVMKTITAAIAIDLGKATPKTRYSTDRYEDGYYKLPGDGSHRWEPTMNLADAIAHSSNIVIGKIAYRLGPQLLSEGMRRFGFGERIGIELPDEQRGFIEDWRKWDKATQSRAGIGQGVSVTALQLISAYQAIANDGVRMQPYVIDRIVEPDGTTTKFTPTEIGRPIKASTARTMREMMLAVASPTGTARRAAVKGYSVAGKTGTAQKIINGHYSDALYWATFCGIVPASDPRLVILVSLDFDQRTKFHQGGNSAGPIFKRLAIKALRHLMVPPDRPDELDDDDMEADDIF